MESDSSMDLTEALRAEIYALGRGPLKRELCQECGEEHYKPDGKCWTNTTCSLCQRKGHPDSNCFKACAKCKTPSYVPHLKTDFCPRQAQMTKLKDHLESLGIDDVNDLLDCLKV
ncbi:hypothetical protein AeMF1_020653 [Aphanomyces euteiches]|nr:hypothetical protein AeMF1_020653 [Aphanomyces euteiches]